MDATTAAPDVQETVPAPGLLEAIKSSSSAPVTPLREDQVQNAVTFLRHPKVAGSTSSAKRAFLKEKGLTDEEIDEGFNRLAKMPPPAATTTLSPVPSTSPPQPAPAPAEAVQQFTWTRAILAVGVVAAGAYGVSTLVSPWVKKWWFGHQDGDDSDDRVVSMLHAMSKKTEDMDNKISALESTMRSVEGRAVNSVDGESRLRAEVSDLKQETSKLSQGINDIKAFLQASSAANSLGSPEVTSRRRPAPFPGTPPSNFSSIDVQHASQPGSAPYSGSMPYSYTPPASMSQAAYPLSNGALGSGASPSGMPPEASRRAASPQPPHPTDYLTVLKMLEQGQTPPGVRTDINDKPTNVDPTPSDAVRRPKPWERQQGQSSTFSPYDNTNAPWDDNSSFGTATETAQPLSNSSMSAPNEDAGAAAADDSGATSKQSVERLQENDASEANGAHADPKLAR